MKFKINPAFRAWMEIVRPPNLFTVPGDVIAGALLAGMSNAKILYLIPAAVCSVIFYVSGLILNDYFDREKDKKERPFRPIPSGRINPVTALLAAICLIVIALIISILIGPDFFMAAIILVLLIVVYNTFARKIPVAGFAVMGLCRGANIILGASLVSLSINTNVSIAALIETIYVAGLTAFAYNEVKGNRASRIGNLVRGLIILQLAFIIFSGFENPAVIIVFMCLFLYLSGRAAKVFYGS
ncbi:MAG: hypothetical protein A2497_02005 [Candidatus Firestonebacteria bacterium RifOxyC12_full_39_7]|nr:MAG: hypothetical protein A2497_02005 [Candidatus Firestonebacteria bacterium RifOxyC12_full_39_7]